MLSGWFRKSMLVMSLIFSVSFAVHAAGGIAIGGTRVVYPAAKKEVGMSVRNTSEDTSFMIQSWVDSENNKSQDFIVTPPLFVSGPRNENTLRIMYVGKPPREDQETLYYFNVKSIPSMNKKDIEEKNVLILAGVTRVKLFLRPAGLKPAIEDAPKMMTFHRQGDQIQVANASPYYITMAKIRSGAWKADDTMVPPHGTALIRAQGAPGNTISFRTINDYGAVTPEQTVSVK